MLASYQLSGCLLIGTYIYIYSISKIDCEVNNYVLLWHCITEYIHPVVPALFSTILASYCSQNYVACWPPPNHKHYHNYGI